jgi:NADPH:quinone reductase-like Zn-dependent oxidoreductase
LSVLSELHQYDSCDSPLSCVKGAPCLAAIQIAKRHAGAAFVATTSSQEDFCKALGADQVINYRNENWWEMKWEQKFDKIIDAVGGGNFYGKAEKVLKTSKNGGEFVAVCGDDPKPDCRTVWKAVKFIANMPWRPLYTWMRGRRYAKYLLIMPYETPEGRKIVLEWMENGTLKIPLDESSPLSFTLEGVKQAFRTVASGHAHGKVVVSMEKK